MQYIDGVVIPVPADGMAAFLDHANRMTAHFMAHGAIRVVDCWSDEVPVGRTTDFHRAVQAGPGEAIVFAWVEWPSKSVRDAAMAAMMNDADMRGAPLPFDGARMIMGGFRTIHDTP